MAELESGTRPGRHESYDAAADIKSKQVALGIQQAYLRADARMHQPDTGYDVGPQGFLRNRFRDRDDHVARQRRHRAARNGLPLTWSEELRRLFEIAFNAQEFVAEKHRRYAERQLLLAYSWLPESDARIGRELHSDERNDQQVGLRACGGGYEEE